MSADLIDSGRLADTVAVYRRGSSEPTYINKLGSDGEWVSPPGLRTAIEVERTRPWTTAESRDFRAIQDRLTAEMGAEWRPRIGEIENLARPFISPDFRR